MKTRNLLRLIETEEFEKLTNSFNLIFKIYDRGIVLSNGHIYIYIYIVIQQKTGYILQYLIYKMNYIVLI
jgi:hypothetical protein